jgi:hypothetical protein
MNPFDMFRSEINAFTNYILGKWGIVHKGVYFTTKHILGKWGIIHKGVYFTTKHILGKWGIVHKGVYFTTKHILGKWGISRGNETLVTRDLDIAKSWSPDTNA